MSSILKEKLAICYVPCGPTYRESAYKRISEDYFDDDNVYYCVLTDDKQYFSDLKRNNLVVNELKDFYPEYPNVEKNEYFLESTSKTDYSTKFVTQNWLFPFSTYRFSVLQALRLNIKNVALLNTDTTLNFNVFDNSFFDKVEYFYNAVSEWDDDTDSKGMQYVVHRLKEKYGLIADKKVRVLDAAARAYIPKSIESLQLFFDMWNDMVEYLFENNLMHNFRGHYGINDEYILAPIYNVLNLNKRENHCTSRIFNVKHDVYNERYWRIGGNGSIKEHMDYEEYIKINNIQSNG